MNRCVIIVGGLHSEVFRILGVDARVWSELLSKH